MLHQICMKCHTGAQAWHLHRFLSPILPQSWLAWCRLDDLDPAPGLREVQLQLTWLSPQRELKALTSRLSQASGKEASGKDSWGAAEAGWSQYRACIPARQAPSWEPLSACLALADRVVWEETDVKQADVAGWMCSHGRSHCRDTGCFRDHAGTRH